MSDNPFFSIIIPVYNRAEMVSKTIQSVLQQEITDFELILIDDGSSDKSLEVIRKIAETDIRIQIIALSENKGRCFARNTGLKNAQGKWICYLDSDDIYEKNHLESIRQLILENPSYSCFSQNSCILGEETMNKNSIQSNEIKFSDVLKKNLFVPNQICHIKEIGVKWLEEVSYSEDLLFVREILVNHSILHSNKITSNLRIHEDRSMNTVSNYKFIKDNIRTINYLFHKYPEIKLRHKKIIESRTYLICLNLNYVQGYIKNKHLIKKIFCNIYTYFNYLFYLFIFKILLLRPLKQLFTVRRRLISNNVE